MAAVDQHTQAQRLPLLQFVLDLLTDYGLTDFYLENRPLATRRSRSAPTRTGTGPLGNGVRPRRPQVWTWSSTGGRRLLRTEHSVQARDAIGCSNGADAAMIQQQPRMLLDDFSPGRITTVVMELR